MKVVLFCGGAGMRLRGYSEDVPETHGDDRFAAGAVARHEVLCAFWPQGFYFCLGYKANVIKDYFLEYEESVSNDFVFSQGGRKLEFMQRDIDDWNDHFCRHRSACHHRGPSAFCRTLSRVAKRCFSPITVMDSRTSICPG